MGLDLIEIVMDVEDAFGIAIPDEEAGSLSTVGTLISYVQNRVRSYKPDDCATGAAFYRLRRLLLKRLPLNRAAIRPDTLLSELIPVELRREIWSELAAAESQRLPKLRRPAWMMHVAIGILVLVPVFAFVSACLLLMMIAFGITGAIWTRQRATIFPNGCQTVRELASRLARPTESASLSESEIANRVRLIVCDTMGWDLAELDDNRRLA